MQGWGLDSTFSASNISPMVTATLSVGGGPSNEASAAATGLLALASGKRVLLIHAVLPSVAPDNIMLGRTGAEFLRLGPLWRHTEDWLAHTFAFFRALSLLVRPDLIVTIDEGSLPTYEGLNALGINVDTWLTSIYADAAAKATMPLALRTADYTAGLSIHFTTNRDSDYWRYRSRYNHFAQTLHARELRQAVDASVMLPTVYGSPIPHSAYNQSRFDGAVDNYCTDGNSEPRWASPPQNLSSPQLYHNASGAKYTGDKDTLWQNFIDNVNCVRRIHNRRGRIITWEGPPAAAEDTGGGSYAAHVNQQSWLSGQKFKHFAALGATEVLYFNQRITIGGFPYTDDARDNLINGYIAAAGSVPVVDGDVAQQADLNAASITTGSVTTTYADYLASVSG